jgi:hypothetical protein
MVGAHGVVPEPHGNREGSRVKAILPDRFGAVDRGGAIRRRLDGGWRGRRVPMPRRAPPGAARPARLLILGSTFALAGVLAILLSRGGVAVNPVVARTSLGAVTYDGVGYRLLAVNVTGRIPQRGGSAITASGVFEIVKLRLRSTDRRLHLVSSDLLALHARGTYYGVSSPDVLGLSDRQWGAVGATTAVPGQGAISVKAIFDVPLGVTRQPVSLRIGKFGSIDSTPAQTIDLADRAGCCARASAAPSREHAALRLLTPDPVLG